MVPGTHDQTHAHDHPGDGDSCDGDGAAAASASSLAARFRRAARLCRARDLRHLFVIGELVRDVSALIHALQKERGACAMFLASAGTDQDVDLADTLSARARAARSLQARVCRRLDRMDEQANPISAGARFYVRIASALQGLEELAPLRHRVLERALAPADAVQLFSGLIARLLGIGFEASHLASDPATSRALIALISFSQGKEYAGQERALGATVLAGSHADDQSRQRLRDLIEAQAQAFRVFAEFAAPQAVAGFERLAMQTDLQALPRLRALALGEAMRETGEQSPAASANHWFDITTRRIDAMKRLEEELARTLGLLCEANLAEAQSLSSAGEDSTSSGREAPVALAMLITEVAPGAARPALPTRAGLYGAHGPSRAPMRPLLELLEAQSRHIADVSRQLESARSALGQRTVIERARGLLMKSRGLSESEAYSLLRRTAMNQNRRLIEVAESIVGLADILGP